MLLSDTIIRYYCPILLSVAIIWYFELGKPSRIALSETLFCSDKKISFQKFHRQKLSNTSIKLQFKLTTENFRAVKLDIDFYTDEIMSRKQLTITHLDT